MRTGVIALVGSLLICAGCDSDGQAWKFKRVSAIEIRDANFELLRTVDDQADVNDLLSCLERAKNVADTSSPHVWTHNIDIAGSGRWHYDAAAGEFTVLSVAVTPLYRVAEADKGRLERFLAKTEPK